MTSRMWTGKRPPHLREQAGGTATPTGRCDTCRLSMPRKDPQRRREYNRQYRQANPERVKEWQRDNYAKHADARRAAKREEYQENREAQIAYSRQYRKTNPRRVREQQRAYRQANHEQLLASQRAWNAANREKRCETEMIRRHGPEIVTVWAAMWQDQDGLCYLCQRQLEPKKTTVDHDHRCCPKHRSCSRCRRGLACQGCNSLIGYANDDPERLRLVANNLEAALAVVTERLLPAPTGMEPLFDMEA